MNQRGAALLIGVMVGGMMILTLSAVLSNELSTLSDELQRQKQETAGREALRDFAVMARKAHEIWVYNYNIGLGCPVATTYPDPTPGRRFCWPKPIGNAHCIRHPLSTLAAPRILCLNGVGANQIRYSMSEPKTPWQEKWRESLTAFFKAGFSSLNLLAVAQGVGAYSHLPTLAGAPTNQITAALPTVNCSSATAPRENCKRCNLPPVTPKVPPGTPPPAFRNVECVKLEVCLRETAACGIGQWLEQSVGILGR